MFSRASVSLCLVAALVSSALSLRSSPCPDIFRYESLDKPGQWDGVLTLTSDFDLHGVWVRMVFDSDPKEILSQDGFGQIEPRGQHEYLLKNPTKVLKTATPTDVRISVKYEGSKVPSLIGYRLNAKVVCPEQNTVPSDIFRNDVATTNYLSSVLVKPATSKVQNNYECGVVSEGAKNPWQAALYVKENNQQSYICEAVLITPFHVLTAAHCVTYQKGEVRIPPNTIKVQLGRNSLDSTSKPLQTYEVSKIKLYPGYEARNLLNDVAILELASEVIINNEVRPICLSQTSKESPEGVLSGYQLNPEKLTELTSQEVRLHQGDECERKLPELSPLISDHKICASFLKDNSQCVGDSGSGLVSLGANKKAWELRGIVTLGVALQDKYVCNQQSTVLLEDVSKYLKWIRASTL